MTRGVPWLAGAGGLLVYCLTLNKWVSLLNLGTVTRISGWGWRPELGQPLAWILLYPFRWLPEPAIPPALNLFAAVCGALVLVVLARSVALLPHDLTPEDLLRQRPPDSILSTPSAWMPPVLAAILCGLQLSFWEHATSASGEMIDLLVFACVVRCLLEYRIDRNESWLWRCVCLYGAGMANNWALAGYLPVFLAAIVRVTGLRYVLNRRFAARMALWSLAGLSLYLLLPALQGFSSHGRIGFWTALRLHVGSQVIALLSLRRPVFEALALVSLVPLLVLSIRWKSHTVQLGDDTPLGILVTKATGHFVHGLFLLLPIWIALDPVFSPRHLGLGTPMLTYYYICALVFGHCAGYFLLLQPGGNRKWLSKAPAAAGWVLLAALPLALACRNLEPIHTTNGPGLRNLAGQLYSDLPSGRCVVLSEDPRQLFLLRAELGGQRDGKDPLLLDTTSLRSAQYRNRMAGRFKSRWPEPPPTNEVATSEAAEMLSLVSRFAAREPVVYLHPSSGLFFESFTDQPRGYVHRLEPRPAGDEVAVSRLPEAVAATNEETWERRWTNGLAALAMRTKEKPHYVPQWAGLPFRFLRLKTEQNPSASFLGVVSSKSLDDWGVQLQRLGRWQEAGGWFRRALDLNPDNLAARINVIFNERGQRGETNRLDAAAVELQFRGLFARLGDWVEILDANGPVDEPTFLFRTSRLMLLAGHNRQAAAGFMRCAELAPDWMAPKVWLARGYLRLGNFAEVLTLTDQIQSSGHPLSGAGLAELQDCRATAMRALGQTNEAAVFIEGFLSRYREQSEVLSGAADLYAQSGQREQELALLDEMLRRDPNRAGLLSRKGFVQLQLSRPDDAIVTLTKALSLAPSDAEARLLRAVSYLRAGQLDPAWDDYQELLKTGENSRNALFGLGTVAWRKHDTNSAVEFYQQFLSNAIPRSRQSRIALDRLQQLKEGGTP